MSESHYDCPCMEKCPLHHAMQLIGGKWKVQILCAVCNAGAIRYNALRSKLDGVSNTVLSSALRRRGVLHYIRFSAQSDSCSKIGSSSRQLSVGLYSTRTGTSRYSCRVTSPSLSSSRRAEDSTVLLTPSSLLRRAL